MVALLLSLLANFAGHPLHTDTMRAFAADSKRAVVQPMTLRAFAADSKRAVVQPMHLRAFPA